MMQQLYIHCIVYSFVLLTVFAQENKLLDNLESEVEIITGKEPTGKMLMPFHRPYAYPLIVQPVNVCEKDFLFTLTTFYQCDFESILILFSRFQYTVHPLTYSAIMQKTVQVVS